MGSKRKRSNRERTQEKRLAAIDRFAGSSEEEDEERDDEEVPMKPSVVAEDDEPIVAPESDDENPKDDDAHDSEDDEVLTERVPAASGMANAMARILSTNDSTTKQQPVVLSKTTTKLQLQVSKETQEQKELKARRKVNREKRLTCYTVPSVTDADEVELERFHRRVATRGVVALFNAIAQHQQQQQSSKPKEEDNNTGGGKDSFLAKIKQQAVAKDNTVKAEPPVQKVKWDALSDGYKVSSKKNWDEESSSDEDNADKELVQVEEEE